MTSCHSDNALETIESNILTMFQWCRGILHYGVFNSLTTTLGQIDPLETVVNYHTNNSKCYHGNDDIIEQELGSAIFFDSLVSSLAATIEELPFA